MKKILLLIAAMTCLCSCIKEELQSIEMILSESSERITPQEHVRKGIKSITMNTYSAVEKFGQQEKQIQESIVANYNKEGRIINRDHNYYKYNHYNHEEYEYINYDDEKIKNAIKYTFDSECKDIEHKQVKNYDKEGNLVKEIYYNQNGIPAFPTKIYQYDKKNRLIEENLLIHENMNKYNERIYKTYYIYNDKGWLIEKKSHNESDMYGMQTYKYDKKGNCVEVIDYNSEGDVESKTINEYREKNVVISIVYDADGNMTNKTEYSPNEHISYDKKGSISAKTIWKDKKLIESIFGSCVWRIEYNKKGDCEKIVRHQLLRGKEIIDKIIECEYTYY